MITRLHQDLFAVSGAEFSDCYQYRFKLWRTWDASLPVINWLMLNPSTADETKNDPTIEGCQRRAIAWGYGGLIVTNLFAFRATDPEDMKKQADPTGGIDNDMAILQAVSKCKMTICAWGNHGNHENRAAHVTRLLAPSADRLHCLKINDGGQPAHPLYIARSVKPFPFTPENIASVVTRPKRGKRKAKTAAAVRARNPQVWDNDLPKPA